MNVDRLTMLGKQALLLRENSPNRATPDYLKLIEAIDSESMTLRLMNPHRFHNHDSDEYKALTDKWASERLARSKKVLEPA